VASLAAVAVVDVEGVAGVDIEVGVAVDDLLDLNLSAHVVVAIFE
jgi:hypothetical protein